MEFVGSRGIDEVATLDMDATLIETTKDGAFCFYKHTRAYQALNVWWAKQGLIIHTEFGDGNAKAGYEQLRVLRELLEHLPSAVKKVRMRSESAGYHRDLSKYCAEGKDFRFGWIEFACSWDVTEGFKQAVSAVGDREWRRLRRVVDGVEEETRIEWAEVCYVPMR